MIAVKERRRREKASERCTQLADAMFEVWYDYDRSDEDRIEATIECDCAMQEVFVAMIRVKYLATGDHEGAAVRLRQRLIACLLYDYPAKDLRRIAKDAGCKGISRLARWDLAVAICDRAGTFESTMLSPRSQVWIDAVAESRLSDL